MPTGRRDTDVEAVHVTSLMILPLGKTPLIRCPAPLSGRTDRILWRPGVKNREQNTTLSSVGARFFA
jgi:hypothetical protein